MGWDYSYFNPENNPFCKNWLDAKVEPSTLMVVTEVNRATPCTACGKRIGEVSATFYEIKKQIFCASCGYKKIASDTATPSTKKQGEPIAAI